MNIESIVAMGVSFLYANKIIALIIGLAIFLFVWKKPAEAFKAGVFIAIMVVVLYMISLMGGTMFQGAGGKGTMTTKSEEAMDY